MPQPYRNFKHHWSANSEMNQVYEHLSNSVIPKIQQWNKPTDKKSEQENQIKEELKLTAVCKRCEYENSRDSKYCNRCSYPMQDAGEEIANKMMMEKMLYDIISSPERLEKLRTFLSETYKN